MQIIRTHIVTMIATIQLYLGNRFKYVTSLTPIQGKIQWNNGTNLLCAFHISDFQVGALILIQPGIWFFCRDYSTSEMVYNDPIHVLTNVDDRKCNTIQGDRVDMRRVKLSFPMAASFGMIYDALYSFRIIWMPNDCLFALSSVRS